jgi:hypothetical protein
MLAPAAEFWPTYSTISAQSILPGWSGQVVGWTFPYRASY